MESTKGLEKWNNRSRVYHRASLTKPNGSKSLSKWGEQQIVKIVGAKGQLRILQQIP